MVLCELMSAAPEAFLATWAAICFLMFLSVIFFSGGVFYSLFVHPTYNKWQYKINPKFPSPEDVRAEFLQTLKGIAAAAVAPSLALYLSQHGASYAYCGVGEYGWGYLVLSFLVCWAASDFLEWGYHYMGHSYKSMWQVHRHHHRFHNPSPFAVIADEPVDQFVRALPLAIFPMIAPLNMDMLFVLFGVFFYAWGVYLHSGYDVPLVDAHHPWINTSYQHFAHHALSIMNKPYHCGFYIKLWDNLAGSVYPEEKCFCSKCARAKGERSFEAWEKVDLPDYSPLLSPRFWLLGRTPAKRA